MSGEVEVPEKSKYQSAQARREEIVAAARNVLGKEGLKGCTVKKIATEAGVSAGLVIYHFGNVDRLMQAVLDSVMYQARDPQAGNPANEREAVLLLRRAIDRYFDPSYYSRRGLVLWLPIYEAMLLDDGYRQKLLERDNQTIALFAEIISWVVAFRDLNVDASLLARNILSLMDGGWMRWCQTTRADAEPERQAALDYLEMKLGSLEVQLLLTAASAGEGLPSR